MNTLNILERYTESQTLVSKHTKLGNYKIAARWYDIGTSLLKKAAQNDNFSAEIISRKA